MFYQNNQSVCTRKIPKRGSSNHYIRYVNNFKEIVVGLHFKLANS